MRGKNWKNDELADPTDLPKRFGDTWRMGSQDGRIRGDGSHVFEP